MSIAQNFPTISPSLSLDFANVQALDPRITFARATTATYYGTRTAKAEQNLFTYSQEFDNATWAKIGLTATANTDVAPDGTTTAETITASGGASGARSIFQGVPSQSASPSSPVIFSVFAKKGTNNFIQLLTSQASNGFVNFDLDAGTATATTAIGAITSVGNGWYRCVMTITESAAFTTAYVNIVTGTGAVRYESNTLSTTALIWGAQLEQRSTVTAYTPTTTQPVTNYIPVLETAASNVARFDHNPTTFESLGLLIEEQRTNLLTYSSEFDNAAWTKTNATITANTIVAPDGTLTGDVLQANASGGTGVVGFTRNVAITNTTHTFSFYAKAKEFSWAAIDISGFTGATVSGSCYYDLANGVVGGFNAISGTITSVGNGWYRCTGIVTPNSADLLGNFAVYVAEGNNDIVVDKSGTAGIYIWGAQLEAGAFATSYIPTVASQVTRAADSASMTGTNFSSWYNMAGGTIYGESSLVGRPNRSTGIFVQLQGAGNGYFAYQNATFTSQINIFDDTNAAGSTAGASAVNTAQKFATAFSSSGMAAIWAGGAVVTSAYNNKFATATGANLFGAVAGTANWNGRIKKLAFYPLRLTDTQLQALTT